MIRSAKIVRKLYVVGGCILSISLFFIVPLISYAQEVESVTIQPAIIEERVDPGQIFSSTLRVSNISKETKTFYFFVRDITGFSPVGAPVFTTTAEETGFDVSKWVKFSQLSIQIVGGRTAEIPFTITVPRDANPGGYFGAIFAGTQAPKLKETGVGVGVEVGALLNLRISGEVFNEAQLREFRTDKAIYSTARVQFITKIENLGNILVRPRGPLEITDFFGRKVATIRINDEAAGIFPKSVRQFEETWDGEGLFFGRYQVILSLSYGESGGKKTISDALSFWILPLNLIVPSVIGLIGLILGIVVFVRFYVARKLRQMQAVVGATVEVGKGFPYHPKRDASFSRLVFIGTLSLLVVLIFLVLLFFFFA